MLQRVLEPEVMDTEQDALEYQSIDNTAVNEEFVARVLELHSGGGSLLDIGTGPADIAVLLARAAPRLRIVAIDLSEHMLALARGNVSAAGLQQRITVLSCDGKVTGFDTASFDMVISNSLVHHIPDPTQLFAEVARVARPDAGVFIKDLHRPSSEVEHQELVKRYASDCTPYQRQLFADSLHAALTRDEAEAMCRRAGLNCVSVRKTSDRHYCIERATVGSRPGS